MTTTLAALEFEGVNHAWLWCLLFVAGAWVLYTAYRDIFLRTERRLAWALMALRGAGLLALVLAMSKPTWTDENELVDAGRVAIVLDNSISMSLESRYDKARAAVSSLTDSFAESNGGPRVQVDLFDIAGRPLPDGPPAEPRVERTDLVRAVSETTAQLRSKLLLGIVVISDGTDNTGRKDTFELAESSVPIYSAGFASNPEASRLDLAVVDAKSIDKVMVNNKAEVQVTVDKAAGPAIDATVVIKRGGETLPGAKTVRFPAGSGQQQVALVIEPKQAGSFVYTASVSTETGEQLLANNSRHFPLQVDADAINILYLDGFLRYEYKFVSSRLRDDPDVHLLAEVRRSHPERIGLGPQKIQITADLLKNLDLVILGDMEADYLTANEYQTLVDWVGRGAESTDGDQRAHSLLVLGGYHSFGPDGFGNTPLADVLPVVLAADGVRQTEEPFVLNLTEAGKTHPVFKLTSDSVRDASLWKTSAPLLGSSLVQRAKAGATVLAVNPNINIERQPAVVIATGRYGSGQTMVITADTTWRWTRLPRIVGRGDTLFARFWSQSVRWLTGRDLAQTRAQIVVGTDKPAYEVGKEVVIRAVRQTQAESDSNTDVTVEVIDESGQQIPVQLRTRSAEPNVLLGSFYPSAGGRFRIHAALMQDGELLANQAAEFLVHGSELELADTATNRALLKSISERSGGVHVAIEDIDQLSQKIERGERRIPRVERTEYWNSPFLFLFFLASVTGEWVLRRKNHLV